MHRSSLLAVIAVLGLVASAEGGVIAPSKPSQTVILKPGAACTAGFALDTRINDDGTTTPFSIPAKMVLIADFLTWTVSGSASPGNVCGVALRIDNQVVWADILNQSDSSGTCGHSVALPNIAVQSGKTLCLGVTTGGTVNFSLSRVHGFLIKDK
jgi:hypothetical protein